MICSQGKAAQDETSPGSPVEMGSESARGEGLKLPSPPYIRPEKPLL